MTNATVSDNYEGRYISTNWGYNRTNREFAKIIEVSDTGKTVVAQLVKTETVEGDTKRDKRVEPTDETYGDPYRLHVRDSGVSDEPCFRGSYPYISGDPDDGQRSGTFTVVKVSKPPYVTRAGMGH